MIGEIYEDRVLLKKIDTPDKGYLIPQGSEEQSLIGTVTHKGPKVSDVTSIGDVVIFEEYEHKEILIEGEPFVLTREESLICKLKPNE